MANGKLVPFTGQSRFTSVPSRLALYYLHCILFEILDPLFMDTGMVERDKRSSLYSCSHALELRTLVSV